MLTHLSKREQLSCRRSLYYLLSVFLLAVFLWSVGYVTLLLVLGFLTSFLMCCSRVWVCADVSVTYSAVCTCLIYYFRGACLHILQLGLGNMRKNSYICIFSYQSISIIITINVKFVFLSSVKADFCEICRNKTINFP